MVGMPESGKTTFLAALWHVVNDRAANTALRFSRLLSDDVAYLNEITRVWRSTKKQEHTKAGSAHMVRMNLKDAAQNEVTLTFPDVSGESFQGMWERRECDTALADMLKEATSILFFVHADRIKEPVWKSDLNDLVALVQQPQDREAKAAASPNELQRARPWEPTDAPTQVQVVELLQFLIDNSFGSRLKRLAIVLSAWDMAKAEQVSPIMFLKRAMPLVHQYLTNAVLPYEWTIYGISAQGGDFDSAKDVARLRKLDDPSRWIEVAMDARTKKDLTIPLIWLRGNG
jgi:hypothetical protein